MIRPGGVGSTDAELRHAVSSGLAQLNQEHGGRHLGRVAAALGVHRSTVSRWLSEEAAPAFERCMALAERYPDYFDRAQLAELLTRAAVGDRSMVVAAPGSIEHVAPTFDAMVVALTESLEREPVAASDRELLQISLEPEPEAAPAPGESVLETEQDRATRRRYQEVVDRRAREGWRVRVVANAYGPERLDSLHKVAASIDGPDVEIRAYTATVMPVLSQFVIGRRDVFLGFNGGRPSRPTPALVRLESPEAVEWSRRYFESVFDEAPFRVRTPQGVSVSEFDRLRAVLEQVQAI